MKALTIRDPWATLIVHGIKRIETRPRCTKFRGRIAVHAGLKFGPIDGGPDREAWVKRMAAPFPRLAGHVIGTVEIIDCVRAEELLNAGFRGEYLRSSDRMLGDFAVGRWGWILRDPQPLKRPVAAKGSLAFWEWTP